LAIENEEKLIGKKLSKKEVFERKVKAILNLRFGEIEIYNSSN